MIQTLRNICWQRPGPETSNPVRYFNKLYELDQNSYPRIFHWCTSSGWPKTVNSTRAQSVAMHKYQAQRPAIVSASVRERFPSVIGPGTILVCTLVHRRPWPRRAGYCTPGSVSRYVSISIKSVRQSENKKCGRSLQRRATHLLQEQETVPPKGWHLDSPPNLLRLGAWSDIGTIEAETCIAPTKEFENR